MADGKPIPLKPLVWKILFLGIVRGHWSLHKEEVANDSTQSEMERLNTGIAQITPAQDVLALLNEEELMKKRELISKEALKKQAPELDSNLPKAKTESVAPLTQEGFEEALRRASRKTSSPPDEETKET